MTESKAKKMDRADKQKAIQIMANDIGLMETRLVPYWIKQMGYDLYDKGWRRRYNRDPRDQKEAYQHVMLKDMDMAGTPVTWVQCLANRLVEKGWSKDDQGA